MKKLLLLVLLAGFTILGCSNSIGSGEGTGGTSGGSEALGGSETGGEGTEGQGSGGETSGGEEIEPTNIKIVLKNIEIEGNLEFNTVRIWGQKKGDHTQFYYIKIPKFKLNKGDTHIVYLNPDEIPDEIYEVYIIVQNSTEEVCNSYGINPEGTIMNNPWVGVNRKIDYDGTELVIEFFLEWRFDYALGHQGEWRPGGDLKINGVGFEF